jgi:GT2 family glycosyltransferase
MASHNKGIEFMKEKNADWLIIMSAAIRFGKNGGFDFIDVLENNPNHYVIHAGTPNSPLSIDQTKLKHQKNKEYQNGVYGWHLTAFSKDVFENIGTWDENFSPYGYDDIDLSVRIQKHYKGRAGWGTFPVQVSDTTMSHSISLGGLKTLDEPKASYFKRKWGVNAGGSNIDDYYDNPFNDVTKPLSWWPKDDDERANKDSWRFLNG